MDRWQQIEQLFHQAAGRTGAEREAFLAQTCAGDAQLRREVESLLAQAGDDSAFREAPAIGEAAILAASEGADMRMNEGASLGAYKVIALLGKGGMGEVYRARDTKLGRDVAIKILPSSFALDPDRVARFEREARLLATLNHPNIAAIYSIEESGGRKFLVLELVNGETLADRLRRGSIPSGEALRMALQITEALEAAHENGVIHRDLKPANIQVSEQGRIKVLDFGLAKVYGGRVTNDPSESPTMTAAATARGILLGTAAYMSPEQARGGRVDRRTDIWAFGCVLYEMLVGRGLFRENTTTETLAKVLEGPVDLQALPPRTPPEIVRLIQRCLDKDPLERLQHIGDARVEILHSLEGTQTNSATRPAGPAAPRGLRMAGPAVLIVLAILAGWFLARRTVPEPVLVTTRSFIGPIAAPKVTPFGTHNIAISRDGKQLVYSSGGQLFVRPMNGTEAIPVASITNELNYFNHFFSPDGKWLAFPQFYDLFKVPVIGGAPVSIAKFKGRNMGGTWGSDGTIVFSNGTGLFRVSDQGGEPELLIAPEGENVIYVWPEFLPGGRSLLFTRLPAGSVEAAEIMQLDLRTMKSRLVLRGGSGASYLPPRYLVYGTARGLEASVFDPASGIVSGDPAVIPGVQIDIKRDNGAAEFAVSDNGTLVYLPRADRLPSRLVWVDRAGHEEPINTLPPDGYAYPRLSPDGKHVAVDIVQGNRDIYVLDLERGTRVRLSEGPKEDLIALWSRDGSRVYYGSNREGFQVYSRASDGIGPEERLSSNEDVQMPYSLAPNGRFLFFKGPYETADIGVLNLASPDQIEWVLHDKYGERNPDISPDGNWIAYESNESGKNEIFVRPYPDVQKAKVPIGPGVHPRWAPHGNELFYQGLDGGMMSVTVESAATEFRAGTPRQLFPDHRYSALSGATGYDVSPDGRFLMLQRVGEAGNGQIMIGIILNLVQELKTVLR